MNMNAIEDPSTYQQHLQMANFLGQKALQAKNKAALIFVILNDTINIIRYDRALLWNLSDKTPKLLGISGETSVNKNSPMAKHWTTCVENIADHSRPQVLDFTYQTDSADPNTNTKTTMLWLPILANGKLELGLWLELWNTSKEDAPPQELIKLLINFLLPVYGISWEKFSKAFNLAKFNPKKWLAYLLLSITIALLFIIQVPLRIVAPCEVVPNYPILVTAPLDGIIDAIDVKPGDYVSEGDTLFHYNKESPLHELEVARKQVEILISELKRATTLGLNDPLAQRDIAILAIKLEKEKVNLKLVEYRASKLAVKAPQSGIVMLDNPDEWRGNPVKIGEKVLAITDPQNSKVRMWLPEGDNITLDNTLPIKVYLNINPEKSYKARLVYIANETIISENSIPSFIAEGEWINPPKDLKLGLKGTAVLYGEKASIIYYIFRKPWSYLRSLLGV